MPCRAVLGGGARWRAGWFVVQSRSLCGVRAQAFPVRTMLVFATAAAAFAPHPHPRPASRAAVLRRAAPVAREGDGDGVSGAVGGAVLGGLLAGPFGAIWGASLGGSMGAQRGAQKAAEARLEAMGLSREVRQAAAECAKDLEEAYDGLAACDRMHPG